MRIQSIAALVPVAVLPLLLISCGGDEQTVQTEDGEVTVSGDDVSGSFKGEDGSTVTWGSQNVKKPETFPQDVFIPSDAKFSAATVFTEQESHTLIMTSNTGAEELVALYKDEMASEGWKAGSSMDSAGGSMLGFKKGERKVNVVVAGQPPQTTVTVTTTGD